MTERRLVTIRRINAIDPIEGADAIEVATVDGWKVVVSKSDAFRINDLVIFHEIDSLLPERAEYEFLRERCYVKNSVEGAGFRLKTIKLRKQVSQGLILPVVNGTVGYETATGGYTFKDVIEGEDVTEFLGVKKYDRILSSTLGGKARGNFPPFVPKTDAERIQNCYRTFEREWKNHTFEVTTKLDGTSFTAYRLSCPDTGHNQFGVCSRNLDLIETEDNLYWQIARKYQLEEKLASLHFDAAIQGEIMGPTIQGNKEQLNDNKLFVFNIFDIENRIYIDADARTTIVNNFDLDDAPCLNFVSGSNFNSVQDFLTMADGPSYNPNVLREGIVFKSIDDPSVQFKAISNKWLLKHGE